MAFVADNINVSTIIISNYKALREFIPDIYICWKLGLYYVTFSRRNSDVIMLIYLNSCPQHSIAITRWFTITAIILQLFWILSGTIQVRRYQKGKTNLDSPDGLA